jgi:hypothetical protein
MAEQLPRGLLADPAVQRAMLLPVARRTFTDPVDDITEEQALELAMPGLLYDPMMGMAQTGAMLMGDMPVDPNVMTQTMLDAPLVSGLLSAATGAAPKGTLLGANVFHGGPHRFAAEPDFPHGRPRLDKVGTGEGAQAYGYGFYSAEAPDVARTYQSKVSAMQGKEEPTIDGKPVNWDDPVQTAAFELARHGGNRTAAADFHASVFQGGENNQAVKLLRSDQPLPDVALPGTLYKLDIPDADIAKYLDYDKPLSEQPEILNKIISVTGKTADELKALDADYEALSGRLINLQPETKERQALQLEWDAAFSDPHRKIGSVLAQMDKPIGTFGYDAASKQTGGELLRSLGPTQETSEFLRKAGIPGLKYFDQGSRAGGEGTRNYVTWDQDVLNRSKMLERDGVTLGANKAPTAALPGLLGKTSSELRAEANALRFPNENLNINAELAQSAKDYFGVTRSPNETGYIMQDGTRLDLSGRHYAGGYEKQGDRFVPKAGETDYLGGDRAVDHRELYDLKGLKEGEHQWDAVEQLMRETGAVRYMPNQGISIINGQKVSDKQLKAIVSDFRKSGNSLTVDIDPVGGGSRAVSKTFDRPTVEGVREFIELGANKAPTAALLGLLDDTASRMQRARDMGFDTDNPVYHGTPDVRPINEMGFATPSELLLKKPQRGPYFFSKDRPTAATYADDRRAFDYQNAEPEVIKAFIKQENPLVIDAKGATYDGIDADKIIKQFADSPDKETVARQVKKYAAIMNGKVNSDQLAALASRLGRDGVVIKNVRDTYEGKGKPTDVFMVLGAENIRRTTAKFDPAKADSADLLAANPATAALPGLLQDRSGNIDQRGLLSRTPRNQNSFPMRGLLGQRLYIATTPDGAI